MLNAHLLDAKSPPLGDMHNVHPLNKLRHHPTKVHSGNQRVERASLETLRGCLQECVIGPTWKALPSRDEKAFP